LTGEALLRWIAEDMGIEVHEVLWTIDQIEQHELASIKELIAALEMFTEDPLVFLPQNDIRQRIRRRQRML
jgi:hypothetical protein